MRILKSIFILIFILFFFFAFLELIPIAPSFDGHNPWRIEEGERPLVIPHGGAKHLYPENTLYSFRRIAESGYDVFEVDLALTADGVLVSHHDMTLLRTAGVDIRVRDLTYNQIRNYHFGMFFEHDPYYKTVSNPLEYGLIPARLDELFTEFPEKMYILEIKDTVNNHDGDDMTFKLAVQRLIEVVNAHNMNHRVIVASFDDRVIDYVNEQSNGSLMTGAATNETFKFVILNTLRLGFFYNPSDAVLFLPIKDDIKPHQRDMVDKAPKFIINQITTYDEITDTYYTDLMKQRIIKEAKRHNMAVIFWTVNDEETMRKLINMGVDGIITDRPDLLKIILDEKFPQ